MGVAIIIEAGAIYLVASGLGTRLFVDALPRPLNVDILKAPRPKQTSQEFPPQTQFEKPSPPTVLEPIIKFELPPRTNPITGSQSSRPDVAAPGADTQQRPAANPLAPMFPRGIAATHTQPPYPMLARRTGKEGSVFLSITVGADGSVQNVSVAKTSGDNELDEAAVTWVREHWKYRPATKDGQPVVAQAEAQVTFSLK
jgi:protein TonB